MSERGRKEREIGKKKKRYLNTKGRKKKKLFSVQRGKSVKQKKRRELYARKEIKKIM